MCFLLLIETSTSVCSVALSRGVEIAAIEQDHQGGYSHSERLSVFIREVVDRASVSFSDLSAVAVSRGPGSYTGLRIGTSAAKGLCYGLDIPLISVNTLKAMTVMMLKAPGSKHQKDDLFCPMIDARRMEVYNAVYDHDLNEIKPISADVVEKKTFEKLLKDKKVWFFGDGAPKCRKIIQANNACFRNDVLPSAEGMATLAYKKYQNKQFENTAYFEPFYLKDFIAGKPKIKGLYE